MPAKKSTKRKNTAKKAAQTRAENKKKQERKQFLVKEITIWSSLAICIFY